MKKILVTGACGYLGGRICEYLAKSGYEITAFTSFDPSDYTGWTSLMDKIIIGDICNEEDIIKLAAFEFDIAIHLVSLNHKNSNDKPSFVSSVNVLPTWNLLNSLTSFKLKKFIYFSTIHVYGELQNNIIKENCTLSPQNPYGLTHLLSEQICNYYHSTTDTECINLRLSNSYGNPIFKENDCWWLVVNDFCKSVFESGEIILFSDGSPQRDFIHIYDICNVLKLLIESNNVTDLGMNTFNLTSGKTFTILELAYIVKNIYEKRFNKSANIKFNNKSNSLENCKNMPRYSFDTSKIRKLGHDINKDLNDGINEIFEYLIKNQ